MHRLEATFSEDELRSIYDTYQTCVELVDAHLELCPAPIDGLQSSSSDSEDNQASLAPTALYALTSVSNVEAYPEPYAPVLDQTSVIAFQRLERLSSRFPIHRKIKLIDPRQATLLSVGLSEIDPEHRGIPDATVRGELVETSAARPFYDPDLTHSMSGLARAVKKLSQEARLSPLGFDEAQAIYALEQV